MRCPYCDKDDLLGVYGLTDAGYYNIYTCPCGAEIRATKPNYALGQDIGTAVKNKLKIPAIKAWRQATGHGLKQSKEIIEGIMSVI